MTVSVPRSAIIEELRNTWQWDYHQTILLQAANEIERLEASRHDLSIQYTVAMNEIERLRAAILNCSGSCHAALEGKP